MANDFASMFGTQNSSSPMSLEEELRLAREKSTQPPAMDAATFDPANMPNSSSMPSEGFDLSTLPPASSYIAPSAPKAGPSTKEHLQAKLDMFTGKTPVASGINTSDAIKALLGQNNEELAAAQGAQNNMQLFNVLGRAGAQVGSALTPLSTTKPDEAAFKALQDQAGQPVAQLKAKHAQEKDTLESQKLTMANQKEMSKEDPTSDESKLARDTLRHAYKDAGKDIEVPESLSASMVEKLVAQEEKSADRRIAQSYRAEAAQDKADNKHREKVDKMAVDFGNNIDPNKARTGSLGKNQERFNAVGRIEGLLSQFKDGNVPNIPTREIASALAAMISSGGSTAVSQIEELVPHSLHGDINKVASWITGKPRGMEQQKFIRMYADTVEREKEIAKTQILKAQFEKAFGTHVALKREDPETFYKQLATYTHMSPDDVKAIEAHKDFKGSYLSSEEMGAGSKNSESYDKDVLDYAKSHGISPERALAIKTERTKGK